MSDLFDIEAEEALLGVSLLYEQAIDDAAELVRADDFHVAGHQHIWHAIVTCRATGKADAVTVSLALRGIDDDRCTAEYLNRLMLAGASVSLAKRYAEIIVDFAGRRQLVKAADEMVRMAHSADTVFDAVDGAQALLQRVDVPTAIGGPDPHARQILDGFDGAYNWLVPDFLERGDRLIVTAGEGGGKSVLIHQIGVQVAAGVHPWTLAPVEPRNVLAIDLENPARLVDARYDDLVNKRARNRLIDGRLVYLKRPQGIDLTTRADRQWLLDRCLANEAELLICGPLYKMASGHAERGDSGGEDFARKIALALDDIRARAGVAMILEAHAPHGSGGSRDLRPAGSSVWMRWPEFGIGLRAETDERILFSVEHWRGARDERLWPTHLRRFGRAWPWDPILPAPRAGAA